MQDFEKKSRYASYKQFGVGDEKSGYQLSVAGYDGNAGRMINNIQIHAIYSHSTLSAYFLHYKNLFFY